MSTNYIAQQNYHNTVIAIVGTIKSNTTPDFRPDSHDIELLRVYAGIQGMSARSLLQKDAIWIVGLYDTYCYISKAEQLNTNNHNDGRTFSFTYSKFLRLIFIKKILPALHKMNNGFQNRDQFDPLHVLLTTAITIPISIYDVPRVLLLAAEEVPPYLVWNYIAQNPHLMYNAYNVQINERYNYLYNYLQRYINKISSVAVSCLVTPNHGFITVGDENICIFVGDGVYEYLCGLCPNGFLFCAHCMMHINNGVNGPVPALKDHLKYHACWQECGPIDFKCLHTDAKKRMIKIGTSIMKLPTQEEQCNTITKFMQKVIDDDGKTTLVPKWHYSNQTRGKKLPVLQPELLLCKLDYYCTQFRKGFKPDVATASSTVTNIEQNDTPSGTNEISSSLPTVNDEQIEQTMQWDGDDDDDFLAFDSNDEIQQQQESCINTSPSSLYISKPAMMNTELLRTVNQQPTKQVEETSTHAAADTVDMDPLTEHQHPAVAAAALNDIVAADNNATSNAATDTDDSSEFITTNDIGMDDHDAPCINLDDSNNEISGATTVAYSDKTTTLTVFVPTPSTTVADASTTCNSGNVFSNLGAASTTTTTAATTAIPVDAPASYSRSLPKPLKIDGKSSAEDNFGLGNKSEISSFATKVYSIKMKKMKKNCESNNENMENKIDSSISSGSNILVKQRRNNKSASSISSSSPANTTGVDIMTVVDPPNDKILNRQEIIDNYLSNRDYLSDKENYKSIPRT